MLLHPPAGTVTVSGGLKPAGEVYVVPAVRASGDLPSGRACGPDDGGAAVVVGDLAPSVAPALQAATAAVASTATAAARVLVDMLGP
ncbi:hypothetical protein GCM10027446_11180 [Angustibacter peucedani]